MVRYVHSDNQVTSDAGEFIVMIGGNSRDVQTATVTLMNKMGRISYADKEA